MKKSLVILFVFLMCFCIQGKGQTSLSDTSYLKYCVEILASDSMGGRKPGTKYDMKAADFIATQFSSLKIKPVQKKNYFQAFSYTYDSNEVNTRNVVAIINNKSDGNIIIGAHYDHLGFGGKRSRSYGNHEVHNGADDNASGVALMLDLAKHLKKNGPKKYNYIFVAFSGHEDGLFGSSFFVKSNIIDSNSIKLMINLDMLGRADKSSPTLFIASGTTLNQEAFNVPINNLLTLKPKELPAGDHTAFSTVHIPVLFFTTGTHDDYHKVSDDPGLLNYKAMALINNYLCNIISDVSESFFLLNKF